MKRYDSYKDSGIEWIGEIPSVWKFGKMKYQLSNNDGGVWGSDVENENDGTVVIRSTEITIDGQWDLSNPMKRLLTDSEIEKTLLYSGDIVLTKSSGSPNHIGKSVIVNSEVENLKCCYSNFVQRLRFRNYNSKLYHYILNNHVVREQYRYLTQTTTGLGNLNGTTLNEVFLPFIPLSEQQQIVSFLDTKTSLIDSLIEKTQRKIELLKEKRTSLINELVTKGLNTNVEMRDSGVEWIGEIPNHWRTSKLGFYTTKIGSGSTPRGGSEVYVDSGVPFIRSQNVHFDGLKMKNISHIEPETHQSMKGSTVIKDDVLLNITGGSIGRCCVVNIEGEMNTNQHVSIIRTTKNLLNIFLNYILNSDVGQSQVVYNISGGNREGLTIEGIRDFRITLPPLNEQQQIVEYLDEQTQLIDNTISIEEKRIELLKEYRQSLISEVVTGKRKVV